MLHKQMIVFGEVLFDCFPDGHEILGGAPFNVAWHLQAFGMAPLFISGIGMDSLGESVEESMLEWGMDVSGLQKDPWHPTGIVKIEFQNNEPSYDIIPNSAYDFIDKQKFPLLKRDSLLYHGTLALRNSVSAAALEDLKRMISPSLFFDVNLRSPWWSPEKIRALFEDVSWLKLNEDELCRICPEQRSEKKRIQALLTSHPFESITVTRGKAGASTFFPKLDRSDIQSEKRTTFVDSVGAGDAFSSVLLLGQMKGWDIGKTMQRAQQFASAIVGVRGATIKDRSFYRSFLNAWE